jgi:hypothetical protein
MPKKPLTIRLLFAVYLISPLVILLSNAWINMIPLTGPSGILLRLQPSDWAILFLYTVNAVAVFTVRRAGWWVFLCSSLILIAYNVWGYVKNPLQPFPTLLLYNALLFLGAALLFRREVIAPYFNPRIRWWEADPRYKMDFHALLHLVPPVTAPVRDISAGGCFLSLSQDPPPGVDIPLDLKLPRMHLRLTARAVRKSAAPLAGWGLRFTEIKDSERRGLRILLDRLERLSGGGGYTEEKRDKPRIRLSRWVCRQEDLDRYCARLIDISRTGCCIVHDKPAFSDKGNYHLCFSDCKEGLTLLCRKVWQRREGDNFLTGLHFYPSNREERLKLKRFVSACRRTRVEERNENTKPDRGLI